MGFDLSALPRERAKLKEKKNEGKTKSVTIQVMTVMAKCEV